MRTANVQQVDTDLERAIRDRVADLHRHAAELSEEVQQLRSVAERTVDDAMQTARRSFRLGVDRARDLRDDAATRIRKQPFGAMGLSLGVGAVAGLVAGLMISRCARED